MSGQIAIISAQETVFFSHFEGKLRQWISILIDSSLEEPSPGSLTLSTEDEQIVSLIEVQPGIRQYRAYAPVVWPAPPSGVQLILKVGEVRMAVEMTIGAHRPWTVYLLSDVCTDYLWNYHDELAMRKDDATLLLAELEEDHARENGAPAERNHYNLVHSRQVEFFLAEYPQQTRRLFDHIRRGVITLNPILNMSLTGCMSLEELVRSLYPARRWARQHKLDDHYANLQETPTATWAVASVLAGSGVEHLLRSILPVECPWAPRLEEPPVFVWEGPDGSRIKVRLCNKDYVEGQFVLKGLSATNITLHDQVLPAYAARNDYPFNAIGLVGCYGDLSPHSPELPAIKAATVSAYDRQGWEFPRLVNASHRQFWDDIDAQVKARQIELPVSRGDYGSSWDIWPACLAFDFAAWRRAQERAGAADHLAVIASRLVPDWSEVHRATLENGWTNLLSLADHAWNGSDDLNRETNARLRRRWQINANRFFDETISSGLTALSKMIPSDPYPRVVVFNHLGWKRTALVRLVNPSPITDHLIDQESGAAIPAQIVVEGGQKVLYFIASEVPPTDYRVYILPTPVIPSPVADNPPANSNNRLETPFYMLEVSPRTGGIRRLFDKVRQKELVDPSSPYHLNQSLYLSSGEESTPLSAMIHPGPQGPCFCQLVVYTLLKGLQVKTTLTLYEALDRLDILNEVDKPVSVEKQELDFVFPFKVPHRQVRMEIPGAIITPGAEQRPGSGQAVNVIRRFVDVFNADYGITLSLADSAAVEFGHRTTSEDPHQPDDHNSTIFCLALENMVDYPESIHDQGGVTHFTFRYSLCGHSGGFDPVAALHFAWEDNNELLTCKLPALQQGDLPGGAFRFFTIDPPNIILTGCKIADQEGIILRLWECSGQDTTAVIQVAGLGTLIAARKTDLLETDLAELPVSENRLEVPVKARGFTAVRLLFN